MSAPQNMPNVTWGVGGADRGYCFLHDREYSLAQGDEVCPHCISNREQDLAWRDAEDYKYSDGDNLGDFDEE
jgi:hypothetical protein